MIGGIVLFIYIIILLVSYSMARKIRTSSRGIKMLKFQTYNGIWKKYVEKMYRKESER